MGDGTCRHCAVGSGSHRPRGLCTVCYRDVKIRLRYPNKPRGGQEERDPTEEELEAIISQQMASLPRWWAKASRQQDNEEYDDISNGPRCRMSGDFLLW
jgi:hypothetical protein